MDYEIEDESVLFDDSTNPSLAKRKPPQSAHIQPPVPPERHHDEKRKRQKAELIPEEEPLG